jgi:glycerol-3-phosphate dehydrogenase
MMMNRQQSLKKLTVETFDVCIIGGGASGAGCALDATLRGLKVALIEKDDFASETSSKSTKLIHGGVRYLEQAFKNLDLGQLRQVRHGLEERRILLQNAPHLAHPLALITPVFSWIEGLYYSIGLKLYGWFARHDSLPKAQWLSKKETFSHIPTLTPQLHSSVMYYDGQLDDARYCLALALSAQKAGAVVVNHISVTDFTKDKTGKLTGVVCQDKDKNFTVKARLIINCTGAFADAIRLKANPTLPLRIKASKGVHLMLPNTVLNSTDAMLIPKTKDGRVVFVIPFEGKVMVGTTDDAYTRLEEEPILIAQEVDFLLDTLRPYLKTCPNKKDVVAGFGGIRPLLAATGDKATKRLVRDHEVEHDPVSGLVSLMGGKWTTYRLMAKDTIDTASKILGNTATCQTDSHLLIGAEKYSDSYWINLKKDFDFDDDICHHLSHNYGTLALDIIELGKHDRLHPDFPFLKAEVVYAVRNEMAYTLRDFFARRIRLEILSWEATLQSIDTVAGLMAEELGWSVAEKEKQITEYQELICNFKIASRE